MPELTRRYIVMTMATEGPFDMKDPDAPFVLKPWKDPAALRALEAYRAHCYPELGEELAAWIDTITAGPAVRGGVGSRNAQHIEAKAKPRSRPRARPKPATKAARKTSRKTRKRSR